MAFKMKSSPMYRNYGPPFKDKGHGNPDPHSHVDESDEESFYSKVKDMVSNKSLTATGTGSTRRKLLKMGLLKADELLHGSKTEGKNE